MKKSPVQMFSMLIICLLIALFLMPQPTQAATDAKAHRFDLLIKNGEIVDGTGTARYKADLAVMGDTIVGIGTFPEATAARTIDASGKIVAPGFIDLHTHLVDVPDSRSGAMSSDPKHRAAQNYVAQGVTTAVINSDGYQPGSLAAQRLELQKIGFGPNLIALNGHNKLRAMHMQGSLERPANAQEIARMAETLAADLAAGRSFGISLGTEYFSGRYSSKEEQLALARVAARHNAIFIPHIRSQGIAPMWYKPSKDGTTKPPTLTDAVNEVIGIAEESGATTIFTHMKAWGPGFRGQAKGTIALIQSARARGARIFMDVYPYTSSGSDGDFKAIPLWAVSDAGVGSYEDLPDGFDFAAGLEQTLANPAKISDLRADVEHAVSLKGGAENIVILDHANPQLVGKTYGSIMKERNLDALSVAIALQREGNPALFGGAKMRAISMDERDLMAFYALDWTATSTDGWIVLPEEMVGIRKYLDSNPRCFGSYPKRIAYFSQKLGVDSLERSIRSASGLPAHILGLRDRGVLATGARADIVVLDLNRLKDLTTIEEPSVYPSGVEHVFVNGTPVVKDGKRTLALPGMLLTHRPTPAGVD